MELIAAPEVAELLSDEQLEAVAAQVGTGQARCVRCEEVIDPETGDVSVVLIVDPGPRRAAVRVSHERCGPSVLAEGELPGPADARLAERWATFVLPAVPVVVMQSVASVWMGDDEPALTKMLHGLGFAPALEAFDSDLFASGVGSPPQADGLRLQVAADDLVVAIDGGEELESLPGALTGPWGDLVRSRNGALVAIGSALGLPDEGGIGFDELLPALLDRAVAAWIPLRQE